MKFIAVVLFLCISAVVGAKTKKYKDDSIIYTKKLIGKSKPSPPAIIAIEIVDPNENKTSKNSKRTIDSNLGYGYQSSPKYQVYKYSQHDIPPYRGHASVLSGGIRSHQYDLQKSISYKLPSQSHKTQNLNQYYEPGTTLYSTVNNQGQVGSLSSNIPQGHLNEPQVPVIILRVLPSQLNDPSGSLHPNLPQSHPLASVVNNIDVQALLNKYVNNLLVDQPQQHYQHQSQPEQHYQPQIQPEQHYQPQIQPEEHYQPQIQPEQHYQPQIQLEQHYQPEYQYQHQQPEPEYQYQYVQQPAYQNYHPQSQNEQSLLTHENYPKDTHTRVIFRTDKNQKGISPPTEETKTINLVVPEGAYSAVQVETPDMHYSYTSPADGSTQQYYYQPEVSQNYYYQSVPEASYQQVEPQQQLDYAVPSPPQHAMPYNYHAHQKRSKKTGFSRVRLEQKVDDVIKLDPIRA